MRMQAPYDIAQTRKREDQIRVYGEVTSSPVCSCAASADDLFQKAQSGTIRAISELVFEVAQESDGGFVGECLTEGIFTEANHWEELRQNVREAVAAYFFDQPDRPNTIRLHLTRDEVLANA